MIGSKRASIIVYESLIELSSKSDYTLVIIIFDLLFLKLEYDGSHELCNFLEYNKKVCFSNLITSLVVFNEEPHKFDRLKFIVQVDF